MCIPMSLLARSAAVFDALTSSATQQTAATRARAFSTAIHEEASQHRVTFKTECGVLVMAAVLLRTVQAVQKLIFNFRGK
jgi:hypothetical protein